MAIIDAPPAGLWYQARIVGLTDLSDLADLDPATTGGQAQQASRHAVAQLLPSALDVYLTARVGGEYGSVRITNIPLGTLGLSMPARGGNGESTLGVWIAEDGDQPRAYDDDGPILPLPLSSAIAAHAVRRALGTTSHVFDLGEHGRIAWTPTRVLIDPIAGLPVPIPHLAEFDYDAPVIGNYRSAGDPDYAVWLWFTDLVTDAPEKTPFLLTPGLDEPGEPPRPPRLPVADLATLRSWTDPTDDDETVTVHAWGTAPPDEDDAP